MAKVVMGARKKELGAWRETEEKTERKCSLNAVKSASRTMSTSMVRERAAAPSKANKVCGNTVLRNHQVFAFCAVRKCAHILKLFQRNAYALPSHTLFVAHRPSQKHVPRLLIHTCWFKGHGDVREAYTANMYT